MFRLAGDNEVENHADHHAAHSVEQHEDVGLPKQHPTIRVPMKALSMQATEKPRESQMSPLSFTFAVGYCSHKPLHCLLNRFGHGVPCGRRRGKSWPVVREPRRVETLGSPLLGRSALKLIENQFAMLLECAEALFERKEHRLRHP